ncbi:NAD-dependent epimerase/dehydratase family protein [Pseudooceanicola sp. C21-150M6]|uniref:NAD-dependent epimerase/dehydratase family protein n=1 Tax=Pseudooceanicola sp. C21-150M6 TaxID=3434355 RepID=UPI003D7F3723
MRVMITGAAGFLGRRLTHELIARGHLAGADGTPRAISRLVLTDLGEVPPLPGGATALDVRRIQGDLADPGILQELCAEPYDALFHLASQLTFHAEADPDLAWKINVAPFQALIGGAVSGARVIFASSIAVFGGALPDVVDDSLAPLPQTTYGMHKAVNELILADASRHGRIDGRALRLPIVLIRPGMTQPVVSDQVAAIVREPLEGRAFAAPLPGDLGVPVASAGAVVRGLIALHDVPRAALPPKGALNLPALTVTVSEMQAAAQRAGATGAMSCAPVPATVEVVRGWPGRFVSRYAEGLGIGPDADFDAVIADYLAHREG